MGQELGELNLNGEEYKTREADGIDQWKYVWGSLRDGHCISFLLMQ